MKATTKRETETVTQALPEVKDGLPVPKHYRGRKEAAAERSFRTVTNAYRYPR